MLLNSLYLLLTMNTVLAAEPIDYAASRYVDAWLHHPVVGDVSFDSFERTEGNPVHRGAEPYTWPVNGFRFHDPVSGNDYLYVGEYATGYALTPDVPSRCVVLREKTDGGYENLGPIFETEPHIFEGEVSSVFHAPDVSVLYAEGRYHLCYDWTTQNTTWANASNPPPDVNSGVGYAWAEHPEGPFHQVPRPLATTRDQTPLLGKYKRLYASTLIRRKNDWLVLTLTDSGPYFGWALLGMSSANPEGPYTPLKLLLYPESSRYLPPLLEYFPAFTHDGYIYAPATSVARNRNYQALFRAPMERALEPDAWEGVQFGSLWHAEPVEHENAGIWGQTLSGYVDKSGIFKVMFPSRDSQNRGCISLAQRPWNKPLRERSFVVSAHGGDNLALLRRGGPAQGIKVTMKLRGNAALIWNATMPIGPDQARSDSVPHPHTLAHHTGLQISDGAWELYNVAAPDQHSILQKGSFSVADEITLSIAWQEKDAATIHINDQEVWRGYVPNGDGMFGVLVSSGAWAEVSRFQITGGVVASPPLDYFYTEALSGAAQNMLDWKAEINPLFHYGVGAVSNNNGVRAKWNFEGNGFALWAPASPEYGKARLLVDGDEKRQLDFRSDTATPSREVFRKTDLVPGRHTVILEALDTQIPLDTLTVNPPQ